MPEWSSPRPSSLAEQSMPSRDLAADLAPLEREPAGQGGADGANGTTMPAAMLGAPQTTRVCRRPKSTSASVSLSAFGVRQDLEDLRRRSTPVIATPGLLDRLDLEAEVGERVGDLADGRVDAAEVADPGERSPHAVTFRSVRAGDAHQNCSRKRTSLSKNVLIVRSTP